MIVYVEDSLIENFLVTFLILKCMEKYFSFSTTKTKVFFACAFASVCATLYPIFGINGYLLIIIKCLIGLILTCIAFNGKKMLAKIIVLLVLTSIYAGLNMGIYYFVYGTVNIYENFPTYILLIILYLIYLLCNLTISFLKKRLAICNFVYQVIIINDGKEYKFNAFLDSGNSLLDQDCCAVTVINIKGFNKLYKEIEFEDLLVKNYKNLKSVHYIKSSFANGSAKMLVFKVDYLQIIKSYDSIVIKNASMGLSYSKYNKNFNCDLLLNINSFV